jgi:hypothetical protein
MTGQPPPDRPLWVAEPTPRSNVDFRQFLDESWTLVPSPSLIINEVLSMI